MKVHRQCRSSAGDGDGCSERGSVEGRAAYQLLGPEEWISLCSISRPCLSLYRFWAPSHHRRRILLVTLQRMQREVPCSTHKHTHSERDREMM